jgi:hypothetical protein
METVIIALSVVVVFDLIASAMYINTSKRVLKSQRDIINKWVDRYFKLSKEKNEWMDKYYEIKNKENNG